jgi:acetyltransferase-like isoleucine patch superfamily enzyme
MKIRKFIKTSVKSPLCFARYIRFKILCGEFGEPAGSNVKYACGLRIVQKMKNVKIGKRCSFGGDVVFHADDLIEVGDDCMFAYGVNIVTAGHDYNVPLMRKKVIRKPVRIGSNVWIGVNALILPGVTIKDGAVVGAGAVVTKDVPENAIMIGSPARVIKYRNVL